MSTFPVNSFEALCELAAGKSPNDSTWIIQGRKARPNYLIAQLGKLPRQYDQKQRVEITRICLNADLSRISKCCRFPDWLGYLGLVLHHMNFSPLFFKLCESWAGQLSQMMPVDSDIYARLSDLSKDNGILEISDLELCERELKKLV